MSQLDIFSVNEINNHIKNILESNIPNLYVEGEITNFTRHTSGHIYFSIKDDYSTLRCVFFKQNNYALDFFPKNGDKVILYGNISLYVKGGSYQFNVKQLFSAGKGLLQIKFEKLKAKLDADGLFSSIHKKDIPSFPRKVGLITSPTGAALQDIKNVIFRRYPIELVLYPASVQGQEAIPELIKGVKFFTDNPLVDILIISRGGGSQEDLFIFNNEELVRAIYACPVPVISGIGHEIDFTLTDFVADLRAPTPSASAELAVPDRKQLKQALKTYDNEITLQVRNRINKEITSLKQYDNSLSNLNVESRLHQFRLDLFEIEKRFSSFDNIKSHLKQKLDKLKNELENSFLSRAKLFFSHQDNSLERSKSKLNYCVKTALSSEHHKLEIIKSKLEAHSPLNILKQGFAYVSTNNNIVTSPQQVHIDDLLNIKFYSGNIQAKVIKKTSEL